MYRTHCLYHSADAGASILYNLQFLKHSHEHNVSSSGALNTNSILRKMPIETSLIGNLHPIRKHANLNMCAQRKIAIIPMSKSIDNPLAHCFPWIFWNILSFKTANHCAGAHVIENNSLSLIDHLRNHPLNSTILQKPLATRSFLAGVNPRES